MKHLIVCPEVPPAPIPAGGIGTYVDHISRLLAEAGETVHVISVLWSGASNTREEYCNGRLIIHRLPLDSPLNVAWNEPSRAVAQDELYWLAQSEFPSQAFAWQVALFAEELIEAEDIDIVESQEYDAPLYYFQLRRVLGHGPRRRPPCLIHLHSPSELIVRSNGWEAGYNWFVTARRLENFSIGVADARLCPSEYLARQCEDIYSLDSHSVDVIRYPIGASVPIQRNADTWQSGSIAFVGRLEPRKGVIEWVDAAVQLAETWPSARFEFAGADLPYAHDQSVRQFIDGRIPDHLKNRFIFHGQLSKPDLREMLTRSRIAVVPSRWENFPNTCIEAMGMGLPVIVSPNGGMSEMIEDGRTGWIASTQDAAGLSAALNRALNTPSLDLSTMGRRASKAIHELCDNQQIVEEHIALRERIVTGGSAIRYPSGTSVETVAERTGSIHQRCGTAVIIAVVSQHDLLEQCLERLGAQSRQPLESVVVVNESWGESARLAAVKARAAGWRVIPCTQASKSAAWKAGLDALESIGAAADSLLFLDQTDRLMPKYVELCEEALHAVPGSGVVTAWRRENGKMIAWPYPSLPYSLVYNEFESPLLIRAEGLRGACFPLDDGGGFYALWDLAISILSRGWTGVVVPSLLSERYLSREQESVIDRYRLRRAVLERAEQAAERYVVDIVELVGSLRPRNRQGQSANEEGQRLPTVLRPRDLLKLTPRQQMIVLRAAARDPKRAISFLVWHAKMTMQRIIQRLGTK